MLPGLCHAWNWGSFSNLGLWGWAGFGLNLLLWTGLIAGLIALIIWAVRNARSPQTVEGFARGGENTARQILQARYARGEITRQEYLEMKEDLG